MMIYLDNCCFNRPFDDQQQWRIRLEAEAKLRIQEVIRAGDLELAWSYILDFENESNPFLDRRERIRQWRSYAKTDCVEDLAVKRMAESLRQRGLRQMAPFTWPARFMPGAIISSQLTTEYLVNRRQSGK